MSTTWGGKPKQKDLFEGTSLSAREPRCYESHPILKMGKGVLVGGSASWPIHKDADVYVALQSGSTCGCVSDPWDEQRVVEIQYSISDMQAPPNTARFKKMVDWLCNQLQAGKKVHVGCIGGHGRTGILLSAIVAQLTGEKDAITWVRKHYCKKAVESREQVEWLHKHYGITSVKGSKEGFFRDSGSLRESVGKSTSYEPAGKTYHEWGTPRPLTTSAGEIKRKVIPLKGVTETTKSLKPMAHSRCLWKARKDKG